MYNHASKDYECPICLGIKGIESDKTLVKQDDIVYGDDVVTAFINSFWIKNNPGHVVVVPNQHYENIYDIPDGVAAQIHKIAKNIALAMKQAYTCGGITTLQNNEPAGNQHAFHYHFHIFPRYDNDELHANMMNKQLADPVQRKEFAEKLKKELVK